MVSTLLHGMTIHGEEKQATKKTMSLQDLKQNLELDQHNWVGLNSRGESAGKKQKKRNVPYNRVTHPNFKTQVT